MNRLPDQTRMTKEEYLAKGLKLFGSNRLTWRLICPCCGHAASGQDYKEVGAPEGAIGFSCIGRWMDNPREAFGEKGPGPCNYAGGGLFNISPVLIDINGKTEGFFDFAKEGGDPS